jgi:hypothetical protein
MPASTNIYYVPPTSNDISCCRTSADIIWSCIATAFGCIWLAIHPNIPAPDDKWFAIALRRTRLMMILLILPEFVVLWAIKQWLVAHKLAKKYDGYFIQSS